MTDDIPRTLEPSEAERLATLRAAMTHGGAGGVSRMVGQVLQRGMVRAIVNDLVGDGDDSLEVRWHFSEVLKDVGAAPVTDYELTFNPVDDPHWPQVFAGGALQYAGDDYSISGRTLTVLAGMDLQTDERLYCDYDYLGSVPLSPSGDGLSMPLGSTWKYAAGLGASSSIAAVGFDDSAWATGVSPFGVFGNGTWPAGTMVSSPRPTDIWCRYTGVSLGGDLTFTADVDNALKVYLDGVEIASWSDDGNAPNTYTVTVAASAGLHVIAAHATDDGAGAGYLWLAAEETA